MSYYCTCSDILWETVLYCVSSQTEQNNPSHMIIFDADNNEILLLQFKLVVTKRLPENHIKRNTHRQPSDRIKS